MGTTEILGREQESGSGRKAEQWFEAVGRIEFFDSRREHRVLASAPQKAKRLSDTRTAGSIAQHDRNGSVIAGMSDP